MAEEVVCLLHDGRFHDGVEEGALLALLSARRDVLVVHVLGDLEVKPGCGIYQIMPQLPVKFSMSFRITFLYRAGLKSGPQVARISQPS